MWRKIQINSNNVTINNISVINMTAYSSTYGRMVSRNNRFKKGGPVSVLGRARYRTIRNVYGVWSPTVGPISSFRLHIYVPSHMTEYCWLWHWTTNSPHLTSRVCTESTGLQKEFPHLRCAHAITISHVSPPPQSLRLTPVDNVKFREEILEFFYPEKADWRCWTCGLASNAKDFTQGSLTTVIPKNRPISVAFYDAHRDTEDIFSS